MAQAARTSGSVGIEGKTKMEVVAPARSGWTDERIQFLVCRVADGLSPALIATELEITRNAVLGKAARLGLQLASRPGGTNPYSAEEDVFLTKRHLEGVTWDQIAKELGKGRTRKGVKARARRLKLPSRTNGRAKRGEVQRIQVKGSPKFKLPPLPAELPADAIPAKQRRTLLDLENNTCRFPYGDVGAADFFFCGGEADNASGQVYCRFHTKISRGRYASSEERQQARLAAKRAAQEAGTSARTF